MRLEQCDVLIIGAGPAGAVAASLLRQQGREVLVVEKEQFPRFSIGESLLPQSMQYLEEAGMLQAVVEKGFQFKEGAAFACGERYTDFDFRDKYSKGWGTTYQVQRAQFDHVLSQEAERYGAEVRYQHQVLHVDTDGEHPITEIKDSDGEHYRVRANFILDASGFGRVLPRLLDLETPSNFPVRGALFTHIADGIPLASGFDRNKIRITVHAKEHDIWYWLILFADGRCSLGVVASTEKLQRYQGDCTEQLKAWIAADATLSALLKHAKWDTPARQIKGYAANVKSLWGKNYALLGNAGEFLDPIFSSGVTIAFKSASLAAAVLQRHFGGEPVDWENDYAKPLKKGVDTFRTFVESWYEGAFQRIVFHENQHIKVRQMICSILAGYAWDETNPYVQEPQRRLDALVEICS